ncbi:hypothetical protein PI95_024920 [Hassallia byssoidea VB512170]|uniref:Uncharacterized protein n=1 Tax=Hassallia byssoidea VB512170 TaxID=1304833 RepID=A0A846HEB4_9CYAN|nr:hypothetical protein [Hassalia byssoidea]NEU75712.1 hypothetical protein [Hassalia byssoidea VB512170]
MAFSRAASTKGARSGNLERQIIAWGEERMHEVQQERGVRVKVRADARDDKAGFIALHRK